MLNSFVKRIEDFWFGGSAELSLLIVRRVWVVVMLEMLVLIWLPAFSMMFFNRAPYRTSTMPWQYAAPWNLLEHFSDSGLVIAFALMLVCTVLVWRKEKFQLPLAAVLYLMCCFQELSHAIFFSYHRFLIAIGYCFLFSRNRFFPEWKRCNLFALRLIQLLTTQIYLYNFLTKIVEPRWQSGVAIPYIFSAQRWASPTLHYVLANITIPDTAYAGMTWTTLAVEAFLFWGLWVKKTRNFAIVTALLFHAVLYIFLEIYTIQEMMVVGICSFVDWETVIKRYSDRVVRRAERVSSSCPVCVRNG